MISSAVIGSAPGRRRPTNWRAVEMASDRDFPDRPARPTMGDIRRWLALGDKHEAIEPEDPEVRKDRQRISTLVDYGLRYGDRIMRRLGILERIQLRPELERMLRRRVQQNWTPEGVRDLVDLVLQAWGATATAPEPPGE
jgi:hypothetical protein